MILQFFGLGILFSTTVTISSHSCHKPLLRGPFKLLFSWPVGSSGTLALLLLLSVTGVAANVNRCITVF